MPISQAQYSRRASRDVRSAIAAAIARHLEAITFFNSGGAFRLAAVFDEWPSYLDRYVAPSACVLPSSWRYVDALMTPTLMEDTWEVKGEPGFGLYKLSEVDLELEVSMRTSNVVEREQLILGIEESFQAPGLLMNEASGPRYGLILPLPDYYGLTARVSLMDFRVIDDEERAHREQRDAVVRVSAQAAQVKVGPVFPLGLTIDYKCPCDCE